MGRELTILFTDKELPVGQSESVLLQVSSGRGGGAGSTSTDNWSLIVLLLAAVVSLLDSEL